MMIPPNYGARYGQEFRDMFATLAAKYPVAFVPFLLDQVALKPELMQADGHPCQRQGTAAAARKPLAEAQAAASCSAETRKLACDTDIRGVAVEKHWLKSYPPGVRAEINVNEYPSLKEMIERGLAIHSVRDAYVQMGKAMTLRRARYPVRCSSARSCRRAAASRKAIASP